MKFVNRRLCTKDMVEHTYYMPVSTLSEAIPVGFASSTSTGSDDERYRTQLTV